jgi:hypothetical protein
MTTYFGNHPVRFLSLIFTSVCFLYIIMSYDHFNFVTELNEFDRSKIRESRNVNISICLFIPTSTSRPLSRRVAHHPECRPCSILFRAFRPARLVKSQWPKPRKPDRPSGAVKRPRYAPWTVARWRRRRQRRGPSAA